MITYVITFEKKDVICVLSLLSFDINQEYFKNFSSDIGQFCHNQLKLIDVVSVHQLELFISSHKVLSSCDRYEKKESV